MSGQGVGSIASTGIIIFDDIIVEDTETFTLNLTILPSQPAFISGIESAVASILEDPSDCECIIYYIDIAICSSYHVHGDLLAIAIYIL